MQYIQTSDMREKKVIASPYTRAALPGQGIRFLKPRPRLGFNGMTSAKWAGPDGWRRAGWPEEAAGMNGVIWVGQKWEEQKQMGVVSAGPK